MKHLNVTARNIGAAAPKANRLAVASALVALCAAGFLPTQAHALSLKAAVTGSILGTSSYPCSTGGKVQSKVQCILGSLSGKEERAVVEFNLKGVKRVKKATLSLRITALQGVLGSNGITVAVEGYAGNNLIDVGDYQAPLIGSRLPSTKLTGALVNRVLTIDVTSLLNAAIAKGDSALGIRLLPTSDPGSTLGLNLGDFNINTLDILPTVKSASISSSTSSPTTNSVLSVNVNASNDNQDPMTYKYVWSKNGVVIPGEIKPTLDLSKPGNGDKGDKITVTVSATEGLLVSLPKTSSPLTIADSAPTVANVTVSPSAPKTNSVLSVKVGTSSDADGDALTTTYAWKKNGAIIAGETGPTLDLSKTQNGGTGDKISVVVMVSDGTTSTKVESGAATIANSPIKLTNLSLKSQIAQDQDGPMVFTTNSTLFAEVRSSDDDGGSPTYTFTWSRVRNGQSTVVQTNKGTGSTAKLDLSKAGMGDKGDTIALAVVADDGQGSTDSMAKSAKVINSVPVVTALTLSPTSPSLTSTLTARASATDPDAKDGMDTVSYIYKWRVGSRLLSGENGPTLDLSKYNFVKPGDAVSLELRAADGDDISASKTASVTVTGTTTNASPSAGSA